MPNSWTVCARSLGGTRNLNVGVDGEPADSGWAASCWERRMAKHFELPTDRRSSLENFEGMSASNQLRPSIADYWQNAVSKQDHFDRCKSTVEVLRGELDQACSEMITRGSNPERLNRTRMLELSLCQARSQLVLASQQLDEAITMLRRVHAGRPQGDAKKSIDRVEET